jgi:hypothetical protein
MTASSSLIAAALVKAQAAFGPALKTSTNPHFRSRYADLSACVEAVIDALNANGIALLQRTHPCETGVIIETVFLHSSGESWSSGTLHVPAAKNDAQGYGSALTYARRYSLMAACGIAPEDDDGNAASKKKTGRESPESAVISGPTEAYKALSPDWQAWVDDIATQAENTAATSIPEAIKIIDLALESEQLDDPGVKTAIWSKLSSRTRSAIKAHTQAKA